jgi:glycosyltransferase involved in cell wall biosynthesis
MKLGHKVLFITIVPSPYQRDLFGALSARKDVDLSVCYMDAKSPENPWPEKPLRPFERIMPGFTLFLGGARVHLNWGLPNVSEFDFVVFSGFTSVTGQCLMRHRLRRSRWLFWGEILNQNSGLKGLFQEGLAAPISRACGIVGIGRAAEQDYRRRFPNIPHFCIPYHCDLSPFLAIQHCREAGAPLTFFFCGQMIQRKGVDLLLLGFDRLIARGFDARLLLVGREAELPKFLEIVSPVARSRIRYEGFQPPERLPEYFARSDVFVLPSRHDGWGVVINQALGAGLPIITSNAVGAGLDLVESGNNGLRVPPDDADALYRAMEIVASNSAMVCEWGERSRKKARDITPEAGAEKWVHVFEGLGKNPKH